MLDFDLPLIENGSAESILYELALGEGFLLYCKLETLLHDPNIVYKVTDEESEKAFYVCLDPIVNPEIVSVLALTPDDVLICFDNALTDTSLMNLSARCTIKTL